MVLVRCGDIRASKTVVWPGMFNRCEVKQSQADAEGEEKMEAAREENTE